MRSKDTFKFKSTTNLPEPAIWFNLHGRDVVINPMELYKVLWGSEKQTYFSKDILASFMIFRDEVHGHYIDYTFGHYDVVYWRGCFIQSALCELDQLCDFVIQGGLSAYRNFEKKTAEKMKAGLNDLVIPYSYFQVRDSEAKVEPFSFKFVEPYKCDTRYVLSIGKRTFESYLSDWSTDFNLIRIDIEKFALDFCDDSEIHLYFEDSPTIINLRRQNIYDPDYNIVKNDIVKVAVSPDDFAKEPTTFGWCKSRQLIRELYLGLLGLSIRETDWFENEYGEWKDFRLAAYNKLQSCIIENYIKGVVDDDYIYHPRQRVVDSVDAMQEDYLKLLDTLVL